MTRRIDRDLSRFKQIIKGQIRRDIHKYVGKSEMIGRRGKRLVTIPVPIIIAPKFRHGINTPDVGQGEGEIGEAIGTNGDDDKDGQGAGDQPGTHTLEVEIELEELAQILGEELELPNIEKRGQKNIISTRHRYSGERLTGPEGLRKNKKTFRRAYSRIMQMIDVDDITAPDFDISQHAILPEREDKRYRSFKEVPEVESAALIVYMMDISGSMTDELKEVVRAMCFWIDTWLQSQYKNIDTRYIVHDAMAWLVDSETFYHTRESGGTKISSAYYLADLLTSKEGYKGEKFESAEWNLYGFHFSDGDNWQEDNSRAIALLKDKLLPKFNLIAYTQVTSPWGGGDFISNLENISGDHDNLSLAVIKDVKEEKGIYNAIKAHLGKGK